MEIFEFEWDAGGYGRGILLVAAPDLESAEDYAKSKSDNWYYDGCGARSNIKYTGKETEPTTIVECCYQE